MAEYVCELTDDYPDVPFGSDDYSGTVERRDCRRSFEERGDMWCRGIVGPPVEPDGFCAWGKEKGNE